MTNRQFEEVDSLTDRHGECPTCGNRREELAPGVWDWPESTYNFDGEDHPCDCEDQVLLFRHYLLARIPHEYMNLCADDFFGDKKAFEEAEAYLDNWDNYRRHGMGMGFYSKTQGTGKTFLAMWLARALVCRGESVYCSYFRPMVNTFELPAEARKEEEDRLKRCTVLILDEVARPTNAQQNLFGERFEALVRERSNYNRVTILTTNLTPKELDEMYPRTYSLLAAKEISITVAGNDARREGIWGVNKTLAENGEARPIT